MKRWLLLVTLSLLSSLTAWALPMEQWSTLGGLAGDDGLGDVQPDGQGGWIAVGHTNPSGSSLSDRDVSLLRLGEGGQMQWFAHFGEPGQEERGFSVIPAPWGGFLACGFREVGPIDKGLVLHVGDDGSYQDSVLISPTGTEVWLYDLAILNDTSFVVVGNQDMGTHDDGIIAALDSSLNVLWTVNYTGIEDEYIRRCIVSSSGDIIITGTKEINNGNVELMIASFSPTGVFQWEVLDGDPDNDDRMYGVAEAPDGSFVAGGYIRVTTPTTPNRLFALMKVRPTGSHQWTRVYGGDGYDWGYDLTAYNNGQIAGFLGIGYGNSFTDDPTLIDAFVYFFNTNGDSVWYEMWGGTGFDKGTAVATDGAGSFVLGGDTDNFGAQNSDWFVTLFEEENHPPNGFNLISPATLDTVDAVAPLFVWHQATDPDGDNSTVSYRSEVASDQSFGSISMVSTVDAGTDTSSVHGDLPEDSFLFWRVFAFDAMGDSVVSDQVVPFYTPVASSVNAPATLPEGYAINRVWPNPFNSTVHLEIELAQPKELRVEVFDLLGRRVATLAQGAFLPGTHRLSWQAEVASGNYVLRVRDQAGYEQSQRIQLLR